MNDVVDEDRPPTRRLLVAVLAVVGLVASTAVAAGTSWQSPAEVALAAAPPEETVMTAPVKRLALTDSRSYRGSVIAGRDFFVPAPVAPPPGTSRAVVTKLRAAVEERLDEGDPVAEVSARPVFVLQGAVPSYRDLSPGAVGEDVAQLQDALRRLGFRVRDARGRLGPSTLRALKAFYRARGSQLLTRGTSDPGGHSRESGAASDGKNDSSGEVGAGSRGVQFPAEEAYVPFSEISFVPELPALVQQLPLAVGDSAEGILAVLSLEGPRIEVQLPSAQELTPGEQVQVTVEGDMEVGGTVTAVRPAAPKAASVKRTDTPEVQAGEAWVADITFLGSLTSDAIGRPVVATATTALTDRPVIVVPETAVITSIGGETYVVVVDAAGQEQPTEVVLGVAADGYVQVTGPGASALDGRSVVVSARASGGFR